MGKWILRIVAGLVVLLIVAGVVLYFTVDGLVRSGITSQTTNVTGTDTDLTTAHVSLLGSSGLELEGLALHNPEGFDDEDFFSLDDGEIDVSLGSLMSNKVVIPKLHLNGIRLRVENRGTTLNFQTIQNNIAKNSGTENKKPQEQKSGKKFIIKQIKITDVKLTGDIGGIPGVSLPQISATVPDITLTDVGSESAGGVVLEQVVSQVLTAVLKRGGEVLTDSTGVGFDQFKGQLGDVSDQAKKNLRRMGDNAKKKMNDAAKEAGDKAANKVKDASQKMQNEAGDALRGILGGNKDNEDGKDNSSK